MPSHDLSALNRLVHEIERLVASQSACEQNRQSLRNALVKGQSDILCAHDILHEYVQQAAELDDEVASTCETIKQSQLELESLRIKSSEEESHMLHLQREIQSLGEQLLQHNHVICELQRRLLESGVPMADIMDLRNDGTKVRSDSPTTPKTTSPLTKSFWKSRQKRGR